MSDAARWIDPDDMPEVEQGPSALDARAAERLGDQEELERVLSEGPSEETPVEDRRGYIGGSDAPVVCGLSPWKNKGQLYREKRGEAPPPDLSANKRVYWGTVLEAVVAKEYEKESGVKVRRVNKLLRHPEYPYIAVHLDRMVLDGTKVLECKTTDWSKRDDWGEPGTEEIPDYYLAQAQHSLLVTGRLVCDVAVLFGGNDFAVYHVHRDEHFLRGLLALELDFWGNHVAIGVPPAPETSDDASAIWPTTKPGEIMADERGHLAAEALYSVRARLKELEAEKDALETELKKQLADQGEVLVYKGKKIASWKQATRTSIDTKALAADNPDLAKQYERVRPYRSFRFSYKP